MSPQNPKCTAFSFYKAGLVFLFFYSRGHHECKSSDLFLMSLFPTLTVLLVDRRVGIWKTHDAGGASSQAPEGSGQDTTRTG